MIDLPDLKNHLKEKIPSVIYFYSLDDIANAWFTYPSISGVCINEEKLFKWYQKFSVDKNLLTEKQIEVKNISMKLSLNLKSECFGHIKFQIHSHFNKKKLIKLQKNVLIINSWKVWYQLIKLSEMIQLIFYLKTDKLIAEIIWKALM